MYISAEMPLLICDTAKKANTLIQGSDDWKTLHQLIVMNGLDSVDQESARTKNIKLISYSEAVVSAYLTIVLNFVLGGVEFSISRITYPCHIMLVFMALGMAVSR